jgi:hypothetical protein
LFRKPIDSLTNLTLVEKYLQSEFFRVGCECIRVGGRFYRSKAQRSTVGAKLVINASREIPIEPWAPAARRIP